MAKHPEILSEDSVEELLWLFRQPAVVELLEKADGLRRNALAVVACRLVLSRLNPRDGAWATLADDVPQWVLAAVLSTIEGGDRVKAAAAEKAALAGARRAGQAAGKRLLAAAHRPKPSPAARKRMSDAARKAARRRARRPDGSFVPKGEARSESGEADV